jgi:hypothetical protein
MTWFYASDGQQNGPVSDEQLDELLRSGKINYATLVWREGMTDWQPLNLAARPVATSPPPGTASGATCAECGKIFPLDDLIQLNCFWVCARCKPIFLQRISEGAALPTSGLWRAEKRLVTRSETSFPDRCIKCNAPANGFRLKRVVYWQHPAYYLLLLCNLLVLLIVVLIVRKKAVLHIGLCETHRAQRKQGMIIGWSSLLGSVVLLIVSANINSGWTALAGVLVLLVGGIYGAIRARTITAVKMTKENVWVTGCHRDFLAELPEWLGP